VRVCFKSLNIKMVVWALLWVGLTAWDFSKHSVPLDTIMSGGPPRDGIPAIDQPRLISAKKAGDFYLKDKGRVIALVVKGKKKVYLLKILNWHEIVNDRIGGRVLVRLARIS